MPKNVGMHIVKSDERYLMGEEVLYFLRKGRGFNRLR